MKFKNSKYFVKKYILLSSLLLFAMLSSATLIRYPLEMDRAGTEVLVLTWPKSTDILFQHYEVRMKSSDHYPGYEWGYAKGALKIWRFEIFNSSSRSPLLQPSIKPFISWKPGLFGFQFTG